MKFIIFANGDLTGSNIELDSHAHILAADGGAQHCLHLGFIPEAVIGDFDSLSAHDIRHLEASGAVLHRYPVDKDETDLELALDYALAAGADEIFLYGILGGRWDMSFANILLLATPRYVGIRFQVIASDTRLYILRGGESLDITGEVGDTVSVLPLRMELRGLQYNGLAWPLENASLPFGSPRGVSNRLVGNAAYISLADGVALVVHQPGQEGDHTDSRAG